MLECLEDWLEKSIMMKSWKRNFIPADKKMHGYHDTRTPNCFIKNGKEYTEHTKSFLSRNNIIMFEEKQAGFQAVILIFADCDLRLDNNTKLSSR